MVLRWVIRSAGPLSSNFATGIVGMFVKNANSEIIEAVIRLFFCDNPMNIQVRGLLQKDIDETGKIINPR